MANIDQLIILLEETSNVIKKTQINFKKCPKARLTKGYLQARMQCIDEYWKTFTVTHQELVKFTPRENRNEYKYFANDEYSIVEELYLCTRADMQDALDLLEQSPHTPSMQAAGQVCSGVMPGPGNTPVRLPKIEIPTYYGRYEEWPTFQDLFVSLVHNNASLSDVQKLHYLKCSVAGEAEALLRHIQVTEANYTQAWEILKQRYGNKRIIVNSLLNRLCSYKRVSVQSANLIKSLLDNTTECINSLNNLKINTDTWSPIIIFLIVQKLDQDTRKDWESFSYKSDSDDLPSWADLKGFLESKFRTLELVNPVIESNKSKCHLERSFHTASPHNKVCVLCGDPHSLCHCKQFAKMPLTERNAYVKSKNLCFNCLSAGHSVEKCRVPYTCHKCHKRHHTLLHYSKSEEAVAHTTVSNIQPQSSYTSAGENEIQANAMMTSHFNANQGYALLATAMLNVKSATGQVSTLRALIDQGSQASFISERAAQLLQLKKRPIQGNVTGVGSTKTRINSVVELIIQSTFDKEFSLSTEAYVISKQLTTKLPSKSLTRRDWPHIQGLKLADPTYYRPGYIDLLLGVQEYAQIIQPDVLKGPPGTPCAQKTKLGWILFGPTGEPKFNISSLLVTHLQRDDLLQSVWEMQNDLDRKVTTEERDDKTYRKPVRKRKYRRWRNNNTWRDIESRN